MVDGRKRFAIFVLVALAAAFALPSGSQSSPIYQVKKLTASDAVGDFIRFGETVAVSGDTAVVSAVAEDTGGANAGAAYIYDRDEGQVDNWGEVTKFLASDAEPGDRFSSSVAASGDIVVVGAPGEDDGGSGAGAVYVFRRDEGGSENWGEVKKLTASDAEAGDAFGGHVALSGHTVVISASGEDAGGSGAGAAYVFRRDEGGSDNWGEVKKLTASDAAADALFGSSAAIDGDAVVVGARVADAVYVFERNEGGAANWGELKKLTPSDAPVGAFGFGFSAAISGDAVLVGGPGSAYVFERDEGGANNWGEVKKITASDGMPLDLFGDSVAVNGGIAVIGARGVNTGSFFGGDGAAYVLERDQGGSDNWGEVSRLTVPDSSPFPLFGIAVAIDGDIAVVGSGHEAAYVYASAVPTPIPPQALTDLWNVQLGNDPPITAVVVQTGADLSIDLGYAGGPLIGTIDKASGSFVVSGFIIPDSTPIVMTGTISPDGNSMSGRYSILVSFNEPFTGVRKLDTPTPTSTPTITPTPPPTPVGGIGFAPDLGALPLDAADDRSDRFGVRLPIAALAGVALAGAAWYARRRLS